MEKPVFKAAIVQLRTPCKPKAAFEQLANLCRQAALAGANFITTPESSNIRQADNAKFLQDAPHESEIGYLNEYSLLARELGVTLLIGSAMLRKNSGKTANRSLLFAPNGDLITSYDKIHLFDVNLANGMKITESDTVEAGEKAVVADSDFGKIGLSICYDVRFPNLFKALIDAGAKIITVPAAFTVPTGRAHWKSLLISRALDSFSYIIAPAQGGRHEDGRATYGHSMIISPWGEVLAEINNDEPNFAICEIDLAKVDEARAKIPSWSLKKGFSLP